MYKVGLLKNARPIHPLSPCTRHNNILLYQECITGKAYIYTTTTTTNSTTRSKIGWILIHAIHIQIPNTSSHLIKQSDSELEFSSSGHILQLDGFMTVTYFPLQSGICIKSKHLYTMRFFWKTGFKIHIWANISCGQGEVTWKLWKSNLQIIRYLKLNY